MKGSYSRLTGPCILVHRIFSLLINNNMFDVRNCYKRGNVGIIALFVPNVSNVRKDIWC